MKRAWPVPAFGIKMAGKDVFKIPQKGSDHPAQKYLRHVRESIAPCWYDVGLELLDPKDEKALRVIKTNNSLNGTERCEEMLDIWLQRQPEATWNQLINALRAPGIELNDVASNVEGNLSPSSEELLQQQVEQKDIEMIKLKEEIEVLKKNQSFASPSQLHQLQREIPLSTPTSKEQHAIIPSLKPDSPPLMPTLPSSRYCLEWTQLAQLPSAMYDAFVAVQDKKVYIAGGRSPDENAKHQVYIYDVNTDKWDQLPPSGHYQGIPQIIGGKLTIIGGRLSSTKKITNKVSTFDNASQTWTSYYPDLISVRSRPGVVTHLEHVIVAGGQNGDETPVVQNDIEILNWTENLQWKKISMNLPMPMWDFTPTVSNDNLLIVGYCNEIMRHCRNAFMIPINEITKLDCSGQTDGTSHGWITSTSATNWRIALIPNSFPPVTVGGDDDKYTATATIKYNDDTWCVRDSRNVASLTSARCAVAVAAIGDNAIIVIGGYTKGDTWANAKKSCKKTVELAQAKLMH